MEKIDISSEEKRRKVYSIFDGFKSKQEIHKYYKITDNSNGCRYIEKIANEIGFDLNVYKERKKRYCLFCGKELKHGQTKFCSCSCSAKYFNEGRKLSEETKKKISDSLKEAYKEKHGEVTVEKKVCCVCGKPLPRKKKKYCSKKCQKQVEQEFCEIKCENCGKIFKGRQGRKYCSNRCSSEHRKEKLIDDWKNGKHIISEKSDFPESIRNYILENAGYKCENCGFEGYNKKSGRTILQIHHIDGDSNNNNENNLIVLCPNCHAMTENYMGLNRGHSGRKKRYNKGE